MKKIILLRQCGARNKFGQIANSPRVTSGAAQCRECAARVSSL
jgi:hypothetical protein